MGSETTGIDLTVLTPSLGYGRFIGDAVKSVLDQEGVTIEHIVHDAGSTDETVEVLKSFTPPVRWVSQPDEGQSDALNQALASANGRWVAWLNADEFYFPGALAELVAIGDAEGADVVYGDSVVVDEEGRLLRLAPQHNFNPTILRWYGGFLASNSTIFRRSALESAPWDKQLRIVMDWDLYLKLHRRGARFRHVSHPVGAFRLHDAQVTAGPGTMETRTVRDRYGIPSARIYRRAGKLLHALYKVAAGGFPIQSRAGRLQGMQMRWFETETDAHNFRTLVDRCYKAS